MVTKPVLKIKRDEGVTPMHGIACMPIAKTSCDQYYVLEISFERRQRMVEMN